MTLSGYKRGCGKRSGGVRSVAMVKATAVSGADYDFLSERFSSVTLAGVEAFTLYSLREDEAVYIEHVTRRGGLVSVRHRLSFFVERMDESSRRMVLEIAETGTEGVVAIVTTSGGTRLLVGVSEKFGTGRPLRLVQADGTTGRGSEDANGETVVLESVDTAKAAVVKITDRELGIADE